MQRKKYQSGFTLIEIAIVLVIIATLVGAIFKGHELLTQVQTRTVINDLESISMAVEVYGDRYRTIPGDDPMASRWTGATPGNGDRYVLGLYNTGPGETQEFWSHLRRSGLLTDASDQPWGRGASNSYYGAQQIPPALGMTGLVLCTNVSAKIAIGIDSKLDDGNSATGDVRATVGDFTTSVNGAPAASYNTSSDSYVVCKKSNAKRSG